MERKTGAHSVQSNFILNRKMQFSGSKVSMQCKSKHSSSTVSEEIQEICSRNYNLIQTKRKCYNILSINISYSYVRKELTWLKCSQSLNKMFRDDQQKAVDERTQNLVLFLDILMMVLVFIFLVTFQQNYLEGPSGPLQVVSIASV